VISDQNGNFQFPLLPAGNFEFTSQVHKTAAFYYGQGTLCRWQQDPAYNMLATEDLVSGVAPLPGECIRSESSRRSDGFGSDRRRQNMASMKIFPRLCFRRARRYPIFSVSLGRGDG